jgi:bacillithiol synthase
MDCNATKISYADTGFFSKIVLDYLHGADTLCSFYNELPTLSALNASLEFRKNFTTNRNLLASALREQYKNIPSFQKVVGNMELLSKPTTFTITTAHQPNIYTGPLYFIYKILHAIKLSEYCKQKFPQYDFVPVYYMGSEDADLEELGHIYMEAEKLEWETVQTGAVGRMKVDPSFLKTFDEIKQRTGILPHAEEMFTLINESYKEGRSIQEATLSFVNALFGKYGLVVLIPDNKMLKSAGVKIFEDELLHSHSSAIISETSAKLSDAGYKVQVSGREINLFYLQERSRQRIVKEHDKWKVSDTDIVFTEEELIKELSAHPERFSPNVVLRGLFQELILPNIAFIGGGGELAYWLQYKTLFEFYKVPYPVLVLRNSILFINKKNAERMLALGIDAVKIFQPTYALQEEWVNNNSGNEINVNEALASLESVYSDLKKKVQTIDPTLEGYIESLKIQSGKKMQQLEDKMLRAEKRNHQTAMLQIEKLKKALFPFNSLQERIENFIPFYAKYGAQFLDILYKNSLALEQEFVVLEEA